MAIYIEVLEDLIMWKDGHHILSRERSWLQCDLILSVNQKKKQKKNPNIEKILENEYIKLLSYSLGNGIGGIFSLSIFINYIKLA